MTLLLDQRTDPEVVASGGLHVLVVGVSDYTHLPGRDDVTDPTTFRLTKLESPAKAAFDFYRWIETHQPRLPRKIGSLRVLLSPSALELQKCPEMTSVGAAAATFQQFDDAASAWRGDASAHRDGMAWLYFAGHGLRRTLTDGLLLLADFADPSKQNLFRHCAELEDIFYGMAPAAPDDDVARTQVFFIDTCNFRPPSLGNFGNPVGTKVFQAPMAAVADDRIAPVFSAARPGASAYGQPGEGSFLSRALLRCLEGAAAESDDGSTAWRVSTSSLSKRLQQDFVWLVGRQVPQGVTVGGYAADAPLCSLPSAPEVEFGVRFEPQVAREVAAVHLGGEQVGPPVPFPRSCVIRGGIHQLHVAFGQGYADIHEGPRLYAPPRVTRTLTPKATEGTP